MRLFFDCTCNLYIIAPPLLRPHGIDVWEEGMAENALFVLVSVGRHIHASQPAVVDRVKTNRQHGAFDASRNNTVEERERSIDFIRPSDVGQAGTKRQKFLRLTTKREREKER